MLNWLKNLFKRAPKEIWKNTKVEYLRRERDWGDNPMSIIDHYVYAIHQVSLSTGNKRIVESYQLFKSKATDYEPTN